MAKYTKGLINIIHIIDINILFKQRNNVVINIIIHIFSDTIKIAFYR